MAFFVSVSSYKPKNKVMVLVREFFCRHQWEVNLVFGRGRNTHHDIRRCNKCGKSETIFSGTREEWYEYNQFGKPRN